MEVIDAIESEDTDFLEEHFCSRTLINKPLINGWTPLICAVKSRSHHAVEKLITLGADVNLGCGKRIRDGTLVILENSEITPLQAALDSKDPEMVYILLKNGCRSAANQVSLPSILHRAIKWNAVDLVRLIVTRVIEEDLSVVQSRFDLNQHLLTAVQDNNTKIADAILQMGCNPNQPHENMVPIVVAANNNNMRMSQLLVNYGAHVNKQAGVTLGQANTPLGMAICAGMCQAVKRLLLLGACVNSTIDWSMSVGDETAARGSSMLHLALLKKQKNIIDILLETSVDITLSDDNGDTVFHVICRDVSDMAQEILAQLVAYGQNSAYPSVNLDTRNNAGCTPLMIAAQHGNLAAVQCLLAHHADPILHARSSKVPSVLHEAVKRGSVDIVQLLINHNCDVNLVCNGETPLHVATRTGQSVLLEMLLRAGGDVHMLSQEGGDIKANKRLTCLHLAVLSKQEDVMQLVLENGVGLDMRSSCGDTALMLAARQHGTTILEILLNSDAAMNIRDRNQKQTALSLSVYYGYDDNAETLIAHGADVNMPDKRNASPLYWAVFNGRVKTLQLLIIADAIFTLKILYEFPKNLSVMRNRALFEWLKYHACCVKSLQWLARSSVRRALMEKSKGRSIMKYIYKLPLPARLQRFIALKEENLQSFENGST